jgi:sugar/nucleoside kinase (ribokinase family)
VFSFTPREILMNPPEVLGIGSPFLDHVIFVSEDFIAKIPGKKGGMVPVDYWIFRSLLEESGAPVNLSIGGSSANTIKGLAHLGHQTAFVGKIGQDPAGEIFKKSLKELNITSLLLPANSPTGQLVCFVTPDGERSFRNFLGASQELQASDLTSTMFQNVKLVHIEGYTLLNHPLTEKAMQLAKEANALVSFDLSSFEITEDYRPEIIHLITHYVDILFANIDETKTLTHLPPEKGCDVLKDMCNIAVVMMGINGCWVGQDQSKIWCPAYPVHPIDTTGAGDLFAAGFLHGFLTGKSLPTCAHYGALTAAAVVKVYGAEIPKSAWEKLQKVIMK